MPLPVAKALTVLPSWAVALLLSALLVAAGHRWSDPLQPTAPVVWTLLLLPPALMALWIAVRWRRPLAGEGGESTGSTRAQD